MTKSNKPTKTSMAKMIEQIDSAKKVNPLDLSSDQDLSIALMNLISLEEHFLFSGAKTQKTDFYDLINTVRNMRIELMGRIVKNSVAENGGVWGVSKHLLAASMRLMETGTKALAADQKDDAYNLFDKAYDLYSLFWGINMNLIDLSGVQCAVPELYEHALTQRAVQLDNNDKKIPAESKSMVRKLGAWVKNAVNCCIE